MLLHPLLVPLALHVGARLPAPGGGLHKVLPGDGLVDLLPAESLQLLQWLATDGLAHGHHGGVATKVGDVRARVRVQTFRHLVQQSVRAALALVVVLVRRSRNVQVAQVDLQEGPTYVVEGGFYSTVYLFSL